jgi:hypothetical protein
MDRVAEADEVELRPGVAREAAARAQRETLPFVTVVGPDDLGHIPVTNRAWRDHVPDMYIFSLRQLLEVAQRQAAAREGRAGRSEGAGPTPASAHPNLAAVPAGARSAEAPSHAAGAGAAASHASAWDAAAAPSHRHLHLGEGTVVRIDRASERTGAAKSPRDSASAVPPAAAAEGVGSAAAVSAAPAGAAAARDVDSAGLVDAHNAEAQQAPSTPQRAIVRQEAAEAAQRGEPRIDP